MTTLLEPGTVLVGLYVDMSPRFYRVLKDSGARVRMERLYHSRTPDASGRDQPADRAIPSDKVQFATRRADGSLVQHGMRRVCGQTGPKALEGL